MSTANISVEKESSESEKSVKNDFNNIGREIMDKVQSGPRSHRMGDIYHQIKAQVDKISRETASKRYK